jgi:hypothetical protein
MDKLVAKILISPHFIHYYNLYQDIFENQQMKVYFLVNIFHNLLSAFEQHHLLNESFCLKDFSY